MREHPPSCFGFGKCPSQTGGFLFLEFQGSALECWSSSRLNIVPKSEKVAEDESGKQDELKWEQERRKSEPRAAEKRPKSTERHLGDA